MKMQQLRNLIKNNMKMINDKYICVRSEFSELQHIRDFIVSQAVDFGFQESVASKIALAVDEACANLIKYSFKLDDSQEFCIEIGNKLNDFIVHISDESNSFNPLDVDRPDMQKYFKELKRGGLGIHIMRSVMDNIEYSPSNKKSNKNILKLVKSLNS